MKNILIIHHNDNDGVLSCAIIKRYFMSLYNDAVIDTIGTDYRSTFEEITKPYKSKNNYYLIAIVDVSVTSEENYNWMIDRVIDTGLLYIDHHKSTIDFIQEGHPMNLITGFRVTGLSASMLCWAWTTYDILIDTIYKHYKLKLFNNRILERNDNPNPMDRSIVEDLWNSYDNLMIPTFLKYVDAYDIWDTNTSLGYDSVLDFAENDLTVEQCEEMYKYSSTLIDDNKTKSDCIFESLLEKGKIIRDYKKSYNEMLCRQFGYEDTYIDQSGKKYSVFILNLPIAGSQAFGDRINKYDICCAWYFNGKNYTHSFYSVKVDCSVLCKELGGGGHPGAAGFVCPKPIFE